MHKRPPQKQQGLRFVAMHKSALNKQNKTLPKIKST